MNKAVEKKVEIKKRYQGGLENEIMYN